jgi:DNA-binding MarR family transcriptional regulator
MKEMLREIGKEPGIMSARLARKVKLTSQECSNLAARLARRNLIVVGKAPNRALTYTLTEAE